ncbi:MAG: zinc metallopeptidase [Coriobacteriaceae bacterium]|nr:zinc metallopeptidase [Coriobacteriaceae bacterium]
MSYGYIGIFVVTLIIGLCATGYVKHQIRKYQSVPISSGLSGYEVAQRMLAYHGIFNVTIQRGRADQDFYDPRKRSITLDPDVFDGRSITATATACHEVGHACQHAQGYFPMKIRHVMVPVVNFTSNAWIFLLMIGVAAQILMLIDLAIIFYSFAVLFQIVTLPVEFNASSRAMAYMEATGILQSEQGGAFSVLRACALTYVAAALTSILQLLWLLGQRD